MATVNDAKSDDRGERSLTSVRFELAPGAPATVEISRGEQGEVLLRPDGGSGFEIGLGEPVATHRVWWSGQAVLVYEVAFRIPGRGGGEWLLDLRPGTFRRVAGEGEDSSDS